MPGGNEIIIYGLSYLIVRREIYDTLLWKRHPLLRSHGKQQGQGKMWK
jgi:hypothetical protein